MQLTKKHEYRITLSEQEAIDLFSVLCDFSYYMQKLGIGEVSNRTRLAEDLIFDLKKEIEGNRNG